MNAPEVVVRFLSRADIVACGALDVHAAIDDVENSLRLHAAGQTIMPPETALRWTDAEPDRPTAGRSETGAYALPAYLGGRAPIVGVKWTAHRAGDTGSADPRVMGLIVLTDPASGRPTAVMESAMIGAVRTAASTAVAVRRLGRAGAGRVTVIGAGLHAWTHLRMLATVMPNARRISIANRTRERAVRMVDELGGELPWRPDAVDLDGPAVQDSEIVIACTAAGEPFFERSWVRPGMLAVSIGPFEFTYDAMRAFDAIVVDGWGDYKNTSMKGLFQMYRAGEFDESDVDADLCDLVVRGRTIPRGASVFVSLFGLSIFDIAVASRIARTAGERRIGREWSLFG